MQAQSCNIQRVTGLHNHQQVVSVVQRRLLIVKRWEAHAFEVPPVTLLTPHHDPHAAPLGHVHWLDDQRYLINKADGASDVIQDTDVLDLQSQQVAHQSNPTPSRAAAT